MKEVPIPQDSGMKQLFEKVINLNINETRDYYEKIMKNVTSLVVFSYNGESRQQFILLNVLIFVKFALIYRNCIASVMLQCS